MRESRAWTMANAAANNRVTGVCNLRPRLVARRRLAVSAGIFLVAFASVAFVRNSSAADDLTYQDSQPSTQPQSQPASQPQTQPASRPHGEPESQPGERRRRRGEGRGPGGGPPATSSAPGSHPASASSTTTTSTSTSTSTTSKPAEEPDHYSAVINGRIHPVVGPEIARGTVLAKNGKIIAMGADIQLPIECDVIDAKGMWVYPGLVAAGAGGLHGGGAVEDTTDVFSSAQLMALAGGITTAIAGNDAAKLTYGSVDDIVIRRNLFVNLNLDNRERPKVRSDLERVRNYIRELKQFELEKPRKKDAKAPDKDWLKGPYEQYLKLLQHEATAVTNANRAEDLRAVADIARQFDFDLVIRGAYEGWLCAEELGRAPVSVIVTPRQQVNDNLRVRDERSMYPHGATIENAHRLSEHGVTVAVVPPTTAITVMGLAGRDLLHLNMEAGFAVRGGMSNEEALRTITIDAARVLGVDDRVGSLEAGKDADMIVCDGDILHYMTQVHYSVVNGRVAYDKTRSTLFAHIRPEGKPELPKFDDVWPRRLEWRE